MGFFRWEDDDDRRLRTVTKSQLKPMRSSASARPRNHGRARRALRLVWVNPNIPAKRPERPPEASHRED